MKKPKITIGTLEITGLTAIYARAFRKLGYEVRTITMFKNWTLPDEKYDAVCLKKTAWNFHAHLREIKPIPKAIMFSKIGFFGLKEFIRSLGKNNWFFFIFGSNFVPFHYSFPFLNYIDYAILKKLGNIIISNFCGCDIRDKRTFSQCAEKYHIADCCTPCQKTQTKCDPERARRVARGADKYSDIILSVPDISFLLTKPYYYFWVPIETDQYVCHIPKNRIPKIMHAPSLQGPKGSDIIKDILEKLKENGFQFEPVILDKLSHQEIKEKLSQIDILVDDVLCNTTGKLSLEAMASGCAVLCGLDKKFQGLPEECPAVASFADTLYGNLKDLLENPEKIYKLAARGRDYIERYHDSITVVKRIIHWVEDRPEDELIYPLH